MSQLLGLSTGEGERTGGLPVSQLLGLSTGEADVGISSGGGTVRIAGMEVRREPYVSSVSRFPGLSTELDVRTSAAPVNQLLRLSSLEDERSGDLESTAILWIDLDDG